MLRCIALNATRVLKVHGYSAAFDWADDGSSCSVSITCAYDQSHDIFLQGTVTSSVKVQPTADSMGTTEYSVSGSYDGYWYSSTKEVQDIPAVSGNGLPADDADDGPEDDSEDAPEDDPMRGHPHIWVAVAGVIGLSIALLLLRRR